MVLTFLEMGADSGSNRPLKVINSPLFNLALEEYRSGLSSRVRKHLAPELLTDRTVPGSVPFRAPGQRLRCVEFSSQSDQRLSSNGQKWPKRCKFIVVSRYIPWEPSEGVLIWPPSPVQPNHARELSNIKVYQSLQICSDLLWWLSDDSLVTLWGLSEDSDDWSKLV